MAAASSAAIAEGRAVVARNFPAAWVAPSALAGLPQKVQSLLQRIGSLEGAPTVSQASHGMEVIAIFKSSSSARDAVKTLHRFDLRSEAEKKAVNYEPPKESERFFVQVVEAPAAAAAAPVPASSSATPAAASQPAAPSKPSGPKLRVKPNGVHIWPLPAAWAEKDVMTIAAAYGGVSRIQMENLADNQKGALIDYSKDAHAKAALVGLNGLSLLGTQLHCAMQEEPEPVKPVLRFLIYIDELQMPARPSSSEAEPRLDDRELFVELPSTIRTQEAAREWLATMKFSTGVDEVFLIKNNRDTPTGKAYIRFKSHPEALKALTAINKVSANGGSQPKAAWSESERIVRGTRGPYGLNISRRLCGDNNHSLGEICKATGLSSLSCVLADGKPAHQVHFVACGEEEAQADKCRAILSTELTKIHQLYTKQVRRSLVISGFPASWSEKGLKFVFAPFGGITGVVLEEASHPSGDADQTHRLAYVKLKNASAMEKALSNLHKAKVGDGDLVEESVVECRRWHLQGWSDNSCRATFFIDQLAMNRRPLEAAPSPDDRELFVKNLPLKDMDRQQLQEYFEGFGEVEDFHMITDIFTGQNTGEGYVRFKAHDNAQRCIDALSPENEAEDSNELTGWWSESERVLQRKANNYRFNLIAELVGANGSSLERLISDSKSKAAWLLAESLQQKDRHAPPRSSRQLHFVAQCTEEAQINVFRELLERALEDAHARISDRIEKRKRKADAAGNKENKAAADGAKPMDAAAQAPWSGAPPGAMWPGAPLGYWPPGAPPPGGAPWFPGQVPPGYPPGANPWGQPPAAGVSVFEQAARQPEDKEKEGRHKSRDRKRRRRGEDKEGGAEGEDGKEKKHRRRRHRHAEGGSPAEAEAEA